MPYALWIPLVVTVYATIAYLSVAGNHTTDWWKFMVLWGIGLIPLWPLVARYSRSIASDAIIYDCLLLVSQYGAFWALGTMDGFDRRQWVGFGLVMCGLVLLKSR